MLNKNTFTNRSVSHKIFSKRKNHYGSREYFKEDNPERFNTIYADYARRIYDFIYFRTSDEQTAEDLTSQVFLKAWEKKETYKRTSAPIISWLYTIARNSIIDTYRTGRETVALEDAVTLGSDSPTPAEECEFHFEKEALLLALRKLTPIQKRVVILKFVDGMTNEEIGMQLGKRVGTIRALQMRALQSLHRIMGQNE